MKKRLFLITLITVLLFTMCGLTALADEETLAVSAFYATQDCIELETNLAVTAAPAAVVTDRSTGTALTVNVEVLSSKLYNGETQLTGSDQKRIRITPADGGFDLTKSYNVNVSDITDGTTTLTFEKNLYFSVLFQDDFESYADTDAMLKSWDKFQFSNYSSNDIKPATDEYIALYEQDGNKQLKFNQALNNYILTNADVEKKAAQYDSYALSFDVTNARTGALQTSINQIVKTFQTAGHVRWGKSVSDELYTQIFFQHNNSSCYNAALSAMNDETTTLTEIANRTTGSSDILRFYYNGDFKFEAPGYMYITGNAERYLKFKNTYVQSDIEYGTFGFMGGEGLLIDNVTAYKAIFRDTSDVFEITGTYATEHGIEIETNYAMSAAPAVTLADRAENTSVDVNVTLENSGKRVRITPSSGKLDLKSSYELSVSGITDGYDTLSYHKNLYFDILFSDDFEGYADTDAMLAKWNYIKCGAKSTPAASDYAVLDTDADGNKRMKLQKESNDAFLTNEDAENNASAYDSYVLSYDVENATSGFFNSTIATNEKWTPNYCTAKSTSNSGTPYVLFYGNPSNANEAQWISAFGSLDSKTHITQLAERNGNSEISDVFKMYADGVLKFEYPSGIKAKYKGDYGTFGFSAGNRDDNTNYAYLDNVTAYKALFKDTDDVLAVSDEFATEDCIELEMSAALTSVPEATIKNNVTGGTVPAAVTLENGGKRVRIAPENEKFDLESSYTVTVPSMTDDYDTASFNKVLYFNVLFQDDFEGYADTDAMLKKWNKITKYNGSWDDTDDTGSYIALDTQEDGNHRLVFTKRRQDSILVNKDVTDNTDQYDAYVLTFDVENARNGSLFTFVNCTVPWVGGYAGSTVWDANSTYALHHWGSNVWFNNDLSGLTNEKKTVTQITERTSGAGDIQRYYLDGEYMCEMPAAYENSSFKYYGEEAGKAPRNKGYFGFMGSTADNTSSDNYLYLDNIKAYKAEWAEPQENTVEITNSMLSAKFIEIEYSGGITAVSAKANISLTANGAAVPMTVSVKADGKTALITPDEPLAAEKLYVLTANGVSDIYGNASGTFTKKFIVEDLFSDDFSSYSSTADLDENYTLVETPQSGRDSVTMKPSEEGSGVSLNAEDGKLHITSAMNGKAITPLIGYPQRSKWDDSYILEIDIDTVSDYDSLTVYDYAVYPGSFTKGGIQTARRLWIYRWQTDSDYNTNCIVNRVNDSDGAAVNAGAVLNSRERNLMFRIDNKILSVYNNKTLAFRDNDKPVNVSDADFAIGAATTLSSVPADSATYTQKVYNTEYRINSFRAYKIREIPEENITLLPLANSKKDGEASGEFMIINNTDKAVTGGTLYYAVMDQSPLDEGKTKSNNQLIGLQAVTIDTVEPGQTLTVPYSITYTSGDAYKVYAYLWDGATMRPITASSEDAV